MKIWISYLDDNNKRITGFFERISESNNFIKLKSNSNIITIPYHRILKVKEDIQMKGGKK